MAQPRRGFAPPSEVPEYFERKALRPAFKWLDVWGEEHSYAFMVSGAVELELIQTFHDSIATALREGQSFETWRLKIREDLSRLGWYGPRIVSDPDGKEPDRIVDFSSTRRLRTIFWANMNSARAAGQWERAQRTKKFLPYFLYIRTTSKDPRDEHLGWVGIILPVDHPFWKTHFPPNGWGCKCQVMQITAREAQRLLALKPEPGGIRYTTQVPDLGPPVMHRNRRTGEITMVPAGIDPGWHANPGYARATTLLRNLEARVQDAPPAEAQAKLVEMWADPFLRVAPLLPEKSWLPAGLSPRLAADLPDALSPLVSIATDTILQRFAKHGMDMDDFALLPRIIDAGTVLPDEKRAGNVRTIVARVGKQLWRIFVTLSRNGRLRVTSMHQRPARLVERLLKEHGLRLEDLDDLRK